MLIIIIITVDYKYAALYKEKRIITIKTQYNHSSGMNIYLARKQRLTRSRKIWIFNNMYIRLTISETINMNVNMNY